MPEDRLAYPDAIEQFALLLSIVDSHVGTINWSNVTIPQGRTVKAATLTIAKLRALIKEEGLQPTPKATPKSNGKKRKADEVDDGDGDGEQATPTKRRGRRKRDGKAKGKDDKVTIKQEDNEGVGEDIV